MSNTKTNWAEETSAEQTSKAKIALAKAKELHKDEIPVRVDDKIIIYVKRGANIEKAIANFKERVKSSRSKH